MIVILKIKQFPCFKLILFYTARHSNKKQSLPLVPVLDSFFAKKSFGKVLLLLKKIVFPVQLSGSLKLAKF